jgi:hypothetical protein
LKASGDAATSALELTALRGLSSGPRCATQRSVEDEMRAEPQEYTLAELVDHPGLGLIMTRDGIERRCIALMLDAPSRHAQETDGTGDKSSGSSV